MLNLDAISYKELVNIKSILRQAISDGMTTESLYTRVEKQVELAKRKHLYKQRVRQRKANKRTTVKLICTECGQPSIRILPVNNDATTMVGGSYNSVLMCTNSRCLHTEFTDLHEAELIAQFLEEQE